MWSAGQEDFSKLLCSAATLTAGGPTAKLAGMILDLDARSALRSLARTPGYLITAVLSLSLGIGATAAAFGVIDAVRLRALPFKDGDRLVQLSEVPRIAVAGSCRSACSVSYVTYANVLRTYPLRTLDALAAYTSGGKALNTGGEPVLVTGAVVSQNLFELLDVRLQLGRAFFPEDDRLGAASVVILSHDLWTSQLGQDPAIVGKTVKLSDTQYTVIGVMPAGFNHEVGSQFWLPVTPVLDPSTRPSIRSVTVVGRLAPGRTLAQLRSELAALDPAALGTADKSAGPTRLEAAPLRERYTSSTGSHDLIFAAVVLCVLLIACANVANLALVRTLNQLKEVALRSALGARSARLVRGLVLQNTFLVLVAAGIGLLFAAWFLGVLQSLAVLQSLRPSGMEYRLDARAAGFAVLLALVVGLLLSAVSARIVIRSDMQRTLRQGAAAAGGRGVGNRIQQLFVVTQIASAVVLLTGAGLLTRTSLHLSRLDLGFDAAKVVQGSPSFPHPWRVKEKYLPVTRQIAMELGQVPGAASVGIRATVPLGSPAAPADITPEGKESTLPRGVAPTSCFAVNPGYFRTLGITIARGREFNEQDAENAPPVAMINQWAARRWWPGKDPIGRTVKVDTAPGLSMTLTVIGVARDNRAAQPNLLLAEEGPELYRPFEQAPSAFPTFFVRAAGDPAPLQKPVREILVRLVPDRPLFASLVSNLVDAQLSTVRLNAIRIVAFALIGLCLALMGIHGVLSYAVGRRTQEIGIRGALGATRGGLQRMVLADGVWLTAAGLVLGLPAAALATRLIRGMLYGTNPTDPVVYAAVGLVVAVVSLGAGYLPARRAARVDPVIALRAG